MCRLYAQLNNVKYVKYFHKTPKSVKQRDLTNMYRNIHTYRGEAKASKYHAFPLIKSNIRQLI